MTKKGDLVSNPRAEGRKKVTRPEKMGKSKISGTNLDSIDIKHETIFRCYVSISLPP